ncbi:hypothetical protein HK096_001077, partial [Nowakowskiella sp. JEL0078]
MSDYGDDYEEDGFGDPDNEIDEELMLFEENEPQQIQTFDEEEVVVKLEYDIDETDAAAASSSSYNAHSISKKFNTEFMELDDEKVEDEVETDDDEDVVASYDVYFSQNLVEELFIFQYPTRNVGFAERTALRVKPNSMAFEMDVPFPQRGSKHYNDQTGSEYGVALTDQQLKTVYDAYDVAEQSVYLETQIYSSSVMPLNA